MSDAAQLPVKVNLLQSNHLKCFFVERKSPLQATSSTHCGDEIF